MESSRPRRGWWLQSPLDAGRCSAIMQGSLGRRRRKQNGGRRCCAFAFVLVGEALSVCLLEWVLRLFVCGSRLSLVRFAGEGYLWLCDCESKFCCFCVCGSRFCVFVLIKAGSMRPCAGLWERDLCMFVWWNRFVYGGVLFIRILELALRVFVFGSRVCVCDWEGGLCVWNSALEQLCSFLDFETGLFLCAWMDLLLFDHRFTSAFRLKLSIRSRMSKKGLYQCFSI